MAVNPQHLDRYVVPDMPSAAELAPYLQEIDRNRWYSNFGPLVSRLEQRIAAHLGSAAVHGTPVHLSVTALMTCYDALKIGLQVFRLKPGARILIPSVTFPACPLAVQHSGATPIFADIEEGSWQLTPATARRVAANNRLDAVMPVAVYGVPVPVEAWDLFVQETGIPVIIDAAAAFETQKVPSRCLLAHSFHATKPFSVGEGGVLVSENAHLIDEARCISNFGTRARIVVDDGCNAKMSEYHAAVGHAQLDRWDTVKKNRANVFTIYQDKFRDAGLPLTLQEGVDQIVVSALMLRAHTVTAATVVDELNAHAVTAHRMYLPPLYRHPHFGHLPVVNREGVLLVNASLDAKADHMVISEKMFGSVFGIPFHAFMTEDDINFVMKLLHDVTRNPG